MNPAFMHACSDALLRGYVDIYGAMTRLSDRMSAASLDCRLLHPCTQRRGATIYDEAKHACLRVYVLSRSIAGPGILESPLLQRCSVCIRTHCTILCHGLAQCVFAGLARRILPTHTNNHNE